MLAYTKPYFLIIITFIISFLLDYIYKGSGLNDDLNTVLSVSSFIFGFYIILSVTRAKEKQDAVRRQLRLADGLFVSCSIDMKVFPEEIQKKFIHKIDNYLISSVDYKISDMDKSAKEFYELYEYTTNSVKPNSEMQRNAIQRICGSLYELTKERTLLEVLAKNKSSKLEWGLILSLFLVILFLIFNLSISGLLGSLFIATLVSALTSILLILYRFDNLTWQEGKWVWEPLTRTFILLGLKPYYGDFVINQRRFKIPKGIDYRIAHYPNSYPNMEGKTIEEVSAKTKPKVFD